MRDANLGRRGARVRRGRENAGGSWELIEGPAIVCDVFSESVGKYGILFPYKI